MGPVCLSLPRRGGSQGDLLAEPHGSWSNLPGSRAAWGLVAQSPGRCLGWGTGFLDTSPAIRIPPSSKVPVEGERLQWVSAHDLLVRMVPLGEGNHLGSFSLQDHIKERKSVSVESDPNKAKIS